ncbi:MAG: PEP-CTERM sorting domain-containing protein [Planctomycetota bacterium]|nr:PEP-CTERM sorting domain-containing protein [Planctomycetota bacterium]
MNLKTLVLLSVMVLSTTSVVRAALVDQIPGPFVPVTYNSVNANLSQYDLGASLPNLSNFATAFENFTFASSGVIDSFSWIGQYEAISPGPLPVGGPNFEISFFTSLGATAGSAIPVATFNVGTANETALTGAGAGFYSYTTTGTPFNVVSGTTYFASIVAQLDYGIAGWGLAFSNTNGDGQSVQDFGDTSLTRFTDTVDYAIAISAVPEPSSVAAILTVAGLVAVRRRRVAK